MKKIKYYKIRIECLECLGNIQSFNEVIKSLSKISDKVVKLNTELDLQKSIDTELKKIIDFGFKDMSEFRNVESKYSFVVDSVQRMRDYGLFTSNMNFDIKLEEAYGRKLNFYEFVKSFKRDSIYITPMYLDEQMRESIRDYYKQACKKLIEKEVKYLHQIIEFQGYNITAREELLEYLKDLKLID